MKHEKSGVLIVFGENGKVGVTKDYLLEQIDHLSPISRISAMAGGIRARELPDYQIHYVGCNPLGAGEEAEDMKAVTEFFYPESKGRIKTHIGLLDTSYQSEGIAKFLKDTETNLNDVKVILPIEHSVRAWRQLRGFGIKPKVELSHVIYTTDQSVDASERNRRREEVRDMYFNLNMYLDIMKEYWANFIGIVDNKGLVTRRISDKVRGNYK